MILSSKEQILQYFSELSYLVDIYNFVVRNNDPSFLGKIEYANDITITYSSYYTTEQVRDTWENHKKNIDIHIVLEGNERIGLLHTNSTKVVKAYSELDDTEWLVGSSDYFKLYAGMMAIVFPGEAHQPGLIEQESQLIRKAVVKISVLSK